MKLLPLSGLLPACLLAHAARAQDVAAGKAIFDSNCAPCHGPGAEGKKAMRSPSLRLQEKWYLLGQLDKFKKGIRGAHRDDASGAPMQMTATALEDEQVEQVVAYIVSLGVKGQPKSQHSLTGDATRGKRLYAACAACHGVDGRGNPALRAPGLAGQWDWYVAHQIRKFKSGVRGSHPLDVYGQQMRPMAATLADEQAIRDVTVYIRTLGGTELPPVLQPDPQKGAALFKQCAACHGDQGQGNRLFHAPYLAGQGTWYVFRQLENFRSGIRGFETSDAYGTQMRALVANLSDQALLDLAAHVAALPPPKPERAAPTLGGKVARGSAIYGKTCAPCHGSQGEGDRVLSAPSLAGQPDTYVARQLRYFRSGLRGADKRDPPGRIMRAWAASLADEQAIRDVAAYIASLAPGTAHEFRAVAAGPSANAPLAPLRKPASRTRDAAEKTAWPRGLLSPDKKPPPVVAERMLVPGDAKRGRPFYATCMGCHGENGQGNLELRAPALAGQEHWYIVQQLKNFKAGLRGTHHEDVAGAQMRPMAATLPDEQAMRDVATYIELLPLGKPSEPTLGGDAVKGKALFATCAGCHGPAGHGNAALKAPALAGQADWYLVAQLEAYKAGRRGADPKDIPGSQMRPMAAMLVDAKAVRDVAAYITSLPPKGAAVEKPQEPVQPPPEGTPEKSDVTAQPEPRPTEQPAKPPPEPPRLAGNAAGKPPVATKEPPAAVKTMPPVVAKVDAAKGKALYATCIACHGADGRGNAALKAPALAGQEDWYIIQQLNNFKVGIRGTDPKDTTGILMRPMVATLVDDRAVRNVAAYVSGLPAGKPEKPTLGGDPVRGKVLYATCVACHGPAGHGNPALKAPALAGQADWYLVTQLKAFKAGIRGADPKDVPGTQMRPMAATLADEQAMRDVAAYITSLTPKGTGEPATALPEPAGRAKGEAENAVKKMAPE